MSDKAKRYWLFAFEAYYPSGGMGDFAGSFDSAEEARERAVKIGAMLWQVADSETAEIVDEYDP